MTCSPQTLADSRAKLDRFAELLSQGIDMPAIRERMGLTNGSAQRLMLQIRKELGPQAI